jgi:DMSO reductase anchor subunit
MQLIAPTKQKVWHWLAVVNFFFGGMATGFYLIQSIFPHIVNNPISDFQLVSFTLVASVLLLLGLLLVGLEAGRPMRGFYVFRDFRHSWMSREALAATIFVTAAILNCIIPNLVFLYLAMLAAAVFMISQGLIVYSAKGVTAWNVRIIPLFFVTNGFATGSGLFLLLATLFNLGTNRTAVAISVFAAVINLLVWLSYLKWSRRCFCRTVAYLGRDASKIRTDTKNRLLQGNRIWRMNSCYA